MEVLRFQNEYTLASILPWRLIRTMGESQSANKHLLYTHSVPSRQQLQGCYGSLEKAPDPK